MTTPAGFTGTPKEKLKVLRILTAALSLGVLFFALVVVVLNQMNGPLLDEEKSKYSDIFLVVAAVMAIVCGIVAISLYNKKVSFIKNGNSALDEKLNQYRITLTLYLALCEGAALLSVIIFFLTGEYIVFAITGIMLLAMLLKMPVKAKLINELGIDWKEQDEL